MKSKLNSGLKPLCVGLVALFLIGCGGGDDADIAPLTPDTGTSTGSLRLTNEAELSAYFRQALGSASNAALSGGLNSGSAETTFSSAPPTSDASATIVSGTTLQEVGVDEADLVKSDGNYVYSLDPAASAGSRDTLRRQLLDSTQAGAPLIPVDRLKLPFSVGVSGTGFYLDADRKQIAIVGEGNSGWGIYDNWFVPQVWGQGMTEVLLIDAASASSMQVRRSLRMTGQLIGSRRLASTLYLVLRSFPQVPGFDPLWPTEKAASNQTTLAALKTAQVLPVLSIDGGAEQALVQASECYLQDQNAVKSADIVTIVAIDLAAADHRHAARCFTGGTEAFYMSDKNLYLATTKTAYTTSGTSLVYAQNTATDIHKFSLNGLEIAYRASGSVTGHLGFDQNRKSFRMGEYAGALRVLTQTAPSWGGWLGMPAIATTSTTTAATLAPNSVNDSPGQLTILQETAGVLQKVGELPNAARPQPLGKAGEQLYASRFIGPRGYLVTYRLTDPLYVLDLSNPADPKVAGELQVEGYSDYLFPLSENVLLGVGKDASSDGTSGDGQFAWYQGVKVSLIDVTDPANPRETARSVIGRRGTEATVLHDHHGIAIQTRGNTVRVSLPMSIHETPNQWQTGAANDYFDFTRIELQRFEINLPARSMSALSAVVSTDANERDIGHDRSLLWNDQVHWYENGLWRSSAW